MDTPATCPTCQGQFKPKRRWQRFCSSAHRRAYHKGTGGGDMAKRVEELERRVAELEARCPKAA